MRSQTINYQVINFLSKIQIRYFVYFLFLIPALCILFPIWPDLVKSSQSNDWVNHVRNSYEFKLALLEGQFPPLTAPALDGAIRVPLFQYYTATAYVIPALISLCGIDIYISLKITLFLASFLAGIALFKTCEMLTQNKQAAFLGALAFQLSVFPLVDLYDRGGYPEWISLQYAAFALYACIHLIQTRFQPLSHQIKAFALMVITCVFFIPCHPIQTLYIGITIALLTLGYLVNDKNSFRTKLTTLFILILGFICALLITSFYWIPIIQDYEQIRTTKVAMALSAGTDLRTVLWPWFSPVYHITSTWAPQIGVSYTSAALLLILFFKRLNVLSKLIVLLFILVLYCIVWPAYSPNSHLLHVLFSPTQWTYRLLMPAVIVGALIVALAKHQMDLLITKRLYKNIIFALSLLIITISVSPYLYYLAHRTSYHQTLSQILSPSFNEPSVKSSYALLGTDYRELGWIEDGKLSLNRYMLLPTDGIPFEAEITLPPGTPPLNVIVNNQYIPVNQEINDSHTQLSFSLSLSIGYNPASQYIQFQSGSPSLVIEDLKFRPQGDSEWFRLPESYQFIESSKHRVKISVHTKISGLYQIPLCYRPGMKIYVNDKPVSHQSNDKIFLVVPLESGENVLNIDYTLRDLGHWLMDLFKK